MDADTVIMPRVHQGRNIKRFRDILGVKQEALAAKLEMTQQAFSKLEQKEQIDEKTLNKVAEALQIPVEAIKNMTDEAAFNIIGNTFQNDSSAYVYQYKCNFNPIDKVVELYERMLKAEQEKVRLLQEA
ncbi:transcriptional regulator [Odoribacter laneus]|jgi:transcriptional regulator, XRE family|uniref:helix-turn-helix domain-containing protein n=1 Tax=Odoribacter laneus TaxID=626933 RepID=UPI0018990265|nr:helix-turn-helix transcriptional regulator [Odoribacter laneus]GKI23538.1 transcriptional regulator [Odoribacter laneus]GKI25525.1 transcriptional regulator [Odoribacter laneus]